MNARRVPLTVLAALALLAAGAIPASAQSVGIGAPGHGGLLLDTSTYYRGAPFYDVEVRGVAALPSGQKSTYAVLVQGRAGKLKGGGVFRKRVRVRPSAGPPGPVPSWHPYLSFFRDGQHIQKPLVVELVHKPTKTVVSRDRVVLFDGRFDAQLDPKYGGTTLDDAMFVQIPASGLDALEDTHLSSLPDPTLAAFNQVLQEQAAGTRLEVETETDVGAADKACIPLESTGFDFVTTSAFGLVFAQAQARFATYQSVQKSQSIAGLTGLPGIIVAGGV